MKMQVAINNLSVEHHRIMATATGVKFADGTLATSKNRSMEFVGDISRAKANFVNCDVHAKIMSNQKVKDLTENNSKKLGLPPERLADDN